MFYAVGTDTGHGWHGSRPFWNGYPGSWHGYGQK